MTAPSNNNWRIAGALGITPDPTDPSTQETMFQGIGFPLRPVDNVPSTTTPELPDGTVAEGLPVQWMGTWSQGLYYPKGAMVVDGFYTCIANTLTLEKPAPVPIVPASWVIPSYAPATQNNSSVVHSGHVYTFTDDCFISGLRIWVTELTIDTNYRIVLINRTDPDFPVTAIINDPLLTENAWRIVSLYNQIVPAGTILEIYIDALNSGASNTFSGGWTYQGRNNNGAPSAQGWNKRNAEDLIRFDKTDLDGTDRTSELLGVIEGSTITIINTDNPAQSFVYTVLATTDEVTYVGYTVSLDNVTGGGVPVGTSTATFDVPIPQPTQYAEQTAYWPAGNPAFATVEGVLRFNGVDQSGTANAYGVDIEVSEAIISTEWDIVSKASV